MRWAKLGQVYNPQGIHPKLLTHAANPLPILLEDDVYRVFYSGRDEQNRSSVGFVDLDVVKNEVVYIHDQPVFEHGSEDTFYSHGVSIGNCYEADGERYILFMGWQCPPGEHWRGEIGRLTVGRDWRLRLDGDLPFMALDESDPISLSYPWVSREAVGFYRMWYGSTLTWDAGNGEMLHVINRATSCDGRNWVKGGLAVPYKLGVSQAFSRPTVIGNESDGYHMWFSYRSGDKTSYRIGYATSDDGDNWLSRLADVGIGTSTSGWDSEMIEYPFVFAHKGRWLMLYNGNGYGTTGFGLAVRE
ncbi:hypothetical protein RA280_08250 [Cupriavidus sp. CV2]|uniref:hypothetical protein n=1 Tax=Cupriavidus ulmosensis TaxID=3065913 RepID=UPI00296B34F5|nr:hypothetical protein [Cupriavidus sp. CV2]MDW3681739.1 hypothetical protein [Cupriavidus sp. CV2]